MADVRSLSNEDLDRMEAKLRASIQDKLISDTRIELGDTPALSTLLDELLAAQRFEAFEVVLRSWELVALDVGDRDDILARIYLGRGFVDSAAELWSRAWEERQDARAVIGFARIHAHQGDTRAARELAGEALALDPGLEEARDVLASLA